VIDILRSCHGDKELLPSTVQQYQDWSRGSNGCLLLEALLENLLANVKIHTALQCCDGIFLLVLVVGWLAKREAEGRQNKPLNFLATPALVASFSTCAVGQFLRILQPVPLMAARNKNKQTVIRPNKLSSFSPV
jgi:hypothetical protein